MRPPRFRSTIRVMMVAVAIAAVPLAVAERRLRFTRLADYHAGRSFLTLNAGGGIHVFDPEASTMTAAKLSWHGTLAEKYARAARRPWLPVGPDLPKPD